MALRDDEQQAVFLKWLGEHGPSVMKVARAYTLTSEDCQDLAQEILPRGHWAVRGEKYAVDDQTNNTPLIASCGRSAARVWPPKAQSSSVA